uniref:Uncharacterized protein n=1 Tax=Rhizophora mucronata TaxID=61149 RepID=A0A2P2Q8Z8_RHIMU
MSSGCLLTASSALGRILTPVQVACYKSKIVSTGESSC